MSLIKTAITCVTAAVVFVLVNGQANLNIAVDPNCLGCLCEASTQCNVSEGCHTPYPGGYFCGPFLISWVYWADAGKPIIQNDDPSRKGAFENCVNDLYCAAETVRRYMKKFAEDCTGDGQVTCDDITRIHKLGYTTCTQGINSNDKFWLSYQQCKSRLSVN